VPEIHDRIEWWSFWCDGCGEHTYVGKPEAWTLDEFGEWAALVYGDPPECTDCQRHRRVA
jgi:hypothetical protein